MTVPVWFTIILVALAFLCGGIFGYELRPTRRDHVDVDLTGKKRNPR